MTRHLVPIHYIVFFTLWTPPETLNFTQPPAQLTAAFLRFNFPAEIVSPVPGRRSGGACMSWFNFNASATSLKWVYSTRPPFKPRAVHYVTKINKPPLWCFCLICIWNWKVQLGISEMSMWVYNCVDDLKIERKEKIRVHLFIVKLTKDVCLAIRVTITGFYLYIWESWKDYKFV